MRLRCVDALPAAERHNVALLDRQHQAKIAGQRLSGDQHWPGATKRVALHFSYMQSQLQAAWLKQHHSTDCIYGTKSGGMEAERGRRGSRAHRGGSRQQPGLCIGAYCW